MFRSNLTLSSLHQSLPYEKRQQQTPSNASCNANDNVNYWLLPCRLPSSRFNHSKRGTTYTIHYLFVFLQYFFTGIIHRYLKTLNTEGNSNAMCVTHSLFPFIHAWCKGLNPLALHTVTSRTWDCKIWSTIVFFSLEIASWSGVSPAKSWTGGKYKLSHFKLASKHGI